MSCFRKYDTTTPRFPRCIEKMMRIACSGEESKQRLDVRHGMGGDGPRFPKRSQVGGETSPASLSFESFFPTKSIDFQSVIDLPKVLPDFMESLLRSSVLWLHRPSLTSEETSASFKF
jgi:hypothetical protein